MNNLTQNQLKDLLNYNSTTGIFTWLERPAETFKPGKYQTRACNTWNTRFSGKEAGNKTKPGGSKTFYILIAITINGRQKSYYAHRLVFLYLNGRLPITDVDHIDGDGCNNRKHNLRNVSHQENSKNCSISSNNTSGHTGVTWVKNRQKWRTQIMVDGEHIYGGYFINKEEAIRKRKEMEIQYDFHRNHGRN